MNDGLYKFPRLYVAEPLGAAVTLNDAQAHYLKNVLRRGDGDQVRLFNGRDGEVLADLAVSKREVVATPVRQTRAQTVRTRRVHLLFTPLKKDRLEALIETAVQLDATDLHPVISDRTEVRDVKTDKLAAYITEAAEQCERLDLPVLHPALPLDRALSALKMPVFAGLERSDAKYLSDAPVPDGDCAGLIGPAGGWTDGERDLLNGAPGVVPVTLGPNILRSETAVAVILTGLARP